MKPGDTIEIKGIRATVVSQEEAEQASAVVCVNETDPLILPDNLVGPCADCEDPI
jgi:hypothetical protein